MGLPKPSIPSSKELPAAVGASVVPAVLPSAAASPAALSGDPVTADTTLKTDTSANDGWDLDDDEPFEDSKVQEPASPMPVPDNQAVPAASPTSNVSKDVARDNFLLKAEIEQLRNRIKLECNGEELKALREERDSLRAENEKLRADAVRLERGSQARRRSAEEVDTLRAEVSELRLQEQRLQERLRQNTELADTNARLLSDNERLSAQLARASASGSLEPTLLDGLDEGVARLHELSISLEHVLSQDDGGPLEPSSGGSAVSGVGGGLMGFG